MTDRQIVRKLNNLKNKNIEGGSDLVDFRISNNADNNSTTFFFHITSTRCKGFPTQRDRTNYMLAFLEAFDYMGLDY